MTIFGMGNYGTQDCVAIASGFLLAVYLNET